MVTVTIEDQYGKSVAQSNDDDLHADDMMDLIIGALLGKGWNAILINSYFAEDMCGLEKLD